MKQLYIKTITAFFIFIFLCVLKSPAQITTVFGRATYLGDGYSAASAGLYKPYGFARDNAGNIYIACQGDNRIRKVTASTNAVTTIAGNGVASYSGDGGLATAATFNFSNGLPGLAVDNKGNLYVGDYGNNRVRKIVLSTNIVTTVAGLGTGGYSGDGGLATAAKINGPAGIVVDTTANIIYFADNNNSAIRAITVSTGKIATVAGNGSANYTGDGGLATAATLSFPERFGFDKSGNMYIADEANYVIRKVDVSTKKISTIAGTGGYGYSGDGGLATAATFTFVTGLCIDASGNIYLSDQVSNRVRKIDASTKKISTVAGNGISFYSGDGVVATASSVYHPADLSVDKSNNLYIADNSNNRIRKVAASNQFISTVVGDGTDGFTGAPGALQAQLSPQAVTADPIGNFYIADGPYFDVRAINIANSSFIYAGSPSPNPTPSVKGYSGDGGLATSALFNAPFSVAADASNAIYIADVFNNVVRKINYNTKIVTTIAGNNTAGFSGDGGAATSAQLSNPYGIALDKAGNLYIADALNNRIRKVDAGTQKISTIAGGSTAGDAGDGGLATAAKLNYPYAVAVDTAGNIFIADKGNKRVRKITVSTQKISTVFNNSHVLTGIAVDVAGNIYVSDSTANTVIRIERKSYYSQVVAGNGSKGYSGDGSAALQAKLNNPRGLYINALNQIYVADAGNNVIRKIIMGHLLPVELVRFTATKNNNTALLQWSTATETNNSRFVIERSGDDLKWDEIDNISGYGNTSELHTYSYTDAAPLTGYNYYRLKQVDGDGRFSYSEVRTVVFNNSLLARLYPNPVRDYVTVEINSDREINGDIVIYTVGGSKVKTVQQHLVKGLNQVTIQQLGDLATGYYFVKVVTPAGDFESKFVKVQ